MSSTDQLRALLLEALRANPDLLREALAGAVGAPAQGGVTLLPPAPPPAAEPPPAPSPRVATFAELWGPYSTWAASSHGAWHKVGRCHGVHLLAHFGELPWTECGYSAADAYVAKRRAQNSRRRGRQNEPVHPRTIDHELSTAKACLNWSVQRRLIDYNPLNRYALAWTKEDLALLDKNDRRFHVAEEDVVKLLEAARPALARLMLAFALETGCRRDEFRLLTDDEIDEKAGVVRLARHRTKTRQARTVPLSDLAVSIIRQARTLRELQGVPSPFVFTSPRNPTQAVGRTLLHHWFDAARKAADVKGPKGQEVWIHSLRKTFGTLTAMKTAMPVRLQMEILGHTSEEVHRQYIETTDEHAAAAREHLNARPRDPRIVSLVHGGAKAPRARAVPDSTDASGPAPTSPGSHTEAAQGNPV